MDKVKEELKTIKINNHKYIFIFAYFILVYSAFIYYEIPIIYHIFFITGLVIFTIGFEKKERELARVKMKNFYIKAKLSYRINELEDSLKKDKSDFEKQMLQKVLDEIEL